MIQPKKAFEFETLKLRVMQEANLRKIGALNCLSRLLTPVRFRLSHGIQFQILYFATIIQQDQQLKLMRETKL